MLKLSVVLCGWICIGVSLNATRGLWAADSSRPNIVLILADDLGYGDPRCYGGKIATPAIDSLAAAGVRFTDAHTSSSVCSPTRYGLLTGRYNWRSKLKKGVLGGLSPRLIEPGRTTIASMLKSRGYQTACFGKWHLGMDWVKKPGTEVSELSIETREQVFNVDFAQPIANGPQSVGFDHYFGISASLDMIPYTFIENDRVVALPTEDRDFFMMLGREVGGKTRLGPAAPGFEAADVLPTLARKSTEYIDRHAEAARGDKPMFIYLPLASPHTPILPTGKWLGKSGFNPYADFVMQTDWLIGEVLAALDRNGLANNTLVVFTSDNGCSPQAKFSELFEHGHNPSGPLRGHKADIFEGGHRVPFIVRWPGNTGSAKVSHQLVCLTDVIATLAEIVGAPIDGQTAEDSISFLGALRDNSQTRRDHLVSHSINGTFAIRQGSWKLCLSADSGGWSTPKPGTAEAKTLPTRQLYDLATDLGEQHNQFEQQPGKAQELLALLEQLVASGRSTPGPTQANSGAVDIYGGLRAVQ